MREVAGRSSAVFAALLLIGAVACTDDGGTPSASPSGSPVTLDPSLVFSDTTTPKRSYLFTHDATSGSISHDGGSMYEIRLSGVPSDALYFEDRPGRKAGSIPMARMLKGLFGKSDADPPNASISATEENGEQQMMAVELLSGSFDAGAGRLVYRVRYLAPSGRGAAHYTDNLLTGDFGETSVFIDTIYNDCAGAILNYTTSPLTLESSEKYSHDDWIDDPDDKLAAPASQWSPVTSVGWESESAFARGCWNQVVYGNEQVTVTVYLADPYSGSNTYTCKVEESGGGSDYQCIGPKSDSQTSGDTVSVTFILCTDNGSLMAFPSVTVDAYSAPVAFDCGYLQTELVDSN